MGKVKTSKEKVTEFLEKHSMPVGTKLKSGWKVFNRHLLILARHLIRSSKSLESKVIEAESCEDHRIRLGSLITEETGELLESLSRKDEVSVLHSLANLVYAANTIAVTYDLPLHAAFCEVHRSNMSKEKGEEYLPPNIILVLEKYRDKQ